MRDAPFVEHRLPPAGSYVTLPDGALGKLGALPRGLIVARVRATSRRTRPSLRPAGCAPRASTPRSRQRRPHRAAPRRRGALTARGVSVPVCAIAAAARARVDALARAAGRVVGEEAARRTAPTRRLAGPPRERAPEPRRRSRCSPSSADETRILEEENAHARARRARGAAPDDERVQALRGSRRGDRARALDRCGRAAAGSRARGRARHRARGLVGCSNTRRARGGGARGDSGAASHRAAAGRRDERVARCKASGATIGRTARLRSPEVLQLRRARRPCVRYSWFSAEAWRARCGRASVVRAPSARK